MTAVLDADDWEARQVHLSRAYELVAKIHNSLEITEALDTEARLFHNRPYLVIAAERFAGAITKQIDDQEVKTLPDCLGSVDQISNSVDVLTVPYRREALQELYKAR